MTISEAQQLFLSYGRGERNYSSESLTTMKANLRRWIVPFLGEIELEKLTRRDIVRLRAVLADRKMSPNHQYSVVSTLRAFLKFCTHVLKLCCGVDPNRDIPHPLRPRSFVHYYLTNEEVRRLKDAVDIHLFTGLRMRTLVEVLLGSGLRIS